MPPRGLLTVIIPVHIVSTHRQSRQFIYYYSIIIVIYFKNISLLSISPHRVRGIVRFASRITIIITCSCCVLNVDNSNRGQRKTIRILDKMCPLICRGREICSSHRRLKNRYRYNYYKLITYSKGMIALRNMWNGKINCTMKIQVKKKM